MLLILAGILNYIATAYSYPVARPNFDDPVLEQIRGQTSRPSSSTEVGQFSDQGHFAGTPRSATNPSAL